MRERVRKSRLTQNETARERKFLNRYYFRREKKENIIIFGAIRFPTASRATVLIPISDAFFLVV